MEKGAFVLALALVLPLLLYGVPYAYAAQSSSYHKEASCAIIPGDGGCGVLCNAGDYATGGGFEIGALPEVSGVRVEASSYTLGANQPNEWGAKVFNPTNSTFSGPGDELVVQVICQMPIAVAGIGVPEFGSFYFAIALGAVGYFVLSRRFASRPKLAA